MLYVDVNSRLYCRCIVLVAVLAGLLGCSRPAERAPSLEEVRAEGAPTHESWGVHFYVDETESGSEASRPRLQIVAGYMATYEEKDSTYTVMHPAEDRAGAVVTAYLFDAAGDTSATVTSSRMTYFDRERRVEAQERVVVKTKEGKRLETEHLFWDERERKVRAPGFARIITPSEQIQGYHLVADEDLDTYTLARITGQVTIEE